VAARSLSAEVDAAEWSTRTPAAGAVDAFATPLRGWERLYVDHVMQADTGADLDFLVGRSGSRVGRESH
jgi:dihydroxy-acid dehydratase